MPIRERYMLREIKKITFLSASLVLSGITCVYGVETKGLAPQIIITPIDGLFATGEQIESLYGMLDQSVMLGSGIRYQSPEKKIKHYLETYRAELDGLAMNFSSPLIQESVQKNRKNWKKLEPFARDILAQKHREKIQASVMGTYSDILAATKAQRAMKQHFLQSIPRERRAYVDAAFTMGALLQKLSSYYMIQIWDSKNTAISKERKASIKKYKALLSLLKSSPYAADPSFLKLISRSEKTFTYLEFLWSLSTSTPSLVVKKTQNALRGVYEVKEYITSRL